MTPKNFLEIELKLIADKFHNINIKYGFDTMIDCHIVELTPVNEFYNNKELDDEWIPLSIRFMELFYTEEIAFISSDSTLVLKEVIFEYNTVVCSDETMFSVIYSPLTEQVFDYEFPKVIPDCVIISSAFLNLSKNCIKMPMIDDFNFMTNGYPEAA